MCKAIMTDFGSIMNDISQVSTVGAQFVPFGSYAFGQNAASNTNGLVGTLGQNAASLFGSATGAVSGLMNSPMLWSAGGVALLILLK